MFTGLTESIGRVRTVRRKSGGLELVVEDPFISSNVKTGDSVLVDGVCLTVISADKNDVIFDVSQETVQRTIISGYKTGTAVNCELALRPDGRLGGHFVTGHIDTVGTVREFLLKGDFILFSVGFEKVYSPLVVEKGSVAVNGVSLTVNEVNSGIMSMMLIPKTAEKTNLRLLKPGDKVNIEFDIIGKYIVRYLSKNESKDDRLKRLLYEGEL